MTDILDIANDYARQKAENAKIGLLLDLMIEAIHQNKMDVYDFLEEQHDKLFPKESKNL